MPIGKKVFDELTSLRERIYKKSESLIEKYDINLSENVEEIGKLLNIPRKSLNGSQIQYRYISVSHEELDEFTITIPAGTKFYLTDNIYVYTSIDSKISQTILLDVIFSERITTHIPMSIIKKIDSQNPEINNFIFKTTRIIDPTSNTESTEEYAARIIAKMNLKSISNLEKLGYVLKTIGISNFKVLNNLSLPGIFKVVISPPDLSLFDKYASLVRKLAIETLGDDISSRLELVKPSLRRLEIFNFDQLSDEGIDFINSSPLGALIDINKIKSLFGKNTTIVLDGKNVTKIELLPYEKLSLIVRK